MTRRPTGCYGASPAFRGAFDLRLIPKMKTSNFVFSTMKPQTIATLVLGSMLFVSMRPMTAQAADLAQLTAAVAKWESGQNVEPLRQMEQLARESAGKRAERAELEAALVKLLAPASTFEARRFACQQLAVVGSDASVRALAKLFQDNETIGIACFAFGNRPSAKADKALRDALPAARDMGRRQIISTLGYRRDAKAVKPLAKLARDADAAVAEAAIRALGQIASESTAKEIAELRKEANPACQRALADASLRCAAQLAESGKAEAAAGIYEELVALSQPANVRRGAFIALTRLDTDGGERRILQTLRNGDALLKPVAIASVRSLRSETASATFARELTALTNAEKVWMIESLAARGDAPARAAIIGSLKSSDAGVRRAAAAALGNIGGATAVGPLAKAIAMAKDSDEIRELGSALGTFPSDRATDEAIIAEIKSAQGDSRARLIAALATRPGPQVMTLLLEESGNPDPAVAKAAYRVLARAGAGDSLPLLLQKFASVQNAILRSEVEGFVEQAVGATEDAARRSAAVRDALNQTHDVDSRCALLRLLPAGGDATAFAALITALSEADPQVRDAAVRALAEWPDMSAWNPLFTIWTKPDSAAHRSLALRGLVRLADEANAAPDEKLLARYRELIAGARDDNELKQVLSALGGAAHPEALKLALPLLDRPAVRAEAAAAVKRIAGAVKARHPEAAQSALDRAAEKL